MTCRFCGKNEPLIKAHIIPRGFHKLVSPGNKYADFLYETPSKDIKLDYSQSGPHDGKILCAKCDNEEFKAWEDYGYEFFLKDHNWDRITSYGDGSEATFLKVDEYDYRNLKLFIILILWRMSISTNLSYVRVNLGRYEKIAFDMLKTNNPGQFNDFPIMIAKLKLNSGEPIASIRHSMIGPDFVRDWKGLGNCYVFSMGGYVINIQVDKRPIDFRKRFFFLSSVPPTQILEFPYQGSWFESYIDSIAERKQSIERHKVSK